MSEERTNCLEPSGSVSRAVDNCRKAKVTRVKPAIHHGCIRFLICVEGVEENVGGIVYSFDDSVSLSEMQSIANEVNEIISQNGDYTTAVRY